MPKSVYKARSCPGCGNIVSVSNAGKYYKHGPVGDRCPKGETLLPAEELKLPPAAPDPTAAFLSTEPPEEECPSTSVQSDPSSPKTPTATAETPESMSSPATPGSPGPQTSSSSTTTEPAPLSPSPESPSPIPPTTPAPSSSPTTSGPPASAPGTEAIPGIDEYAEKLAAAQLAAYKAQMAAYAHPAPVSPETRTGYGQPDKVNKVVTEAVPMGVLAQQVTAMIKEIFRAYTRTGRSAQTTLGPSEIGTPCDRRLAMHLLGMPAVNPGNDGWAAFVGTCIHAGFEKIMQQADAGQGRFVTELSLQYPNEHVPHGTADLLDRTLFMIDDYKAMGQWSLDNLKANGPSPGYRVQLHTYGYGARMRGERIDYVALIALPRTKNNLDDMYTWIERYDPSVARNAMARVDRLWADIEAMQRELEPDGDWAKPRDHEVAARIPIVDDCKFCKYHMPQARDLRNGGCNGRV